jgi:hypothetical protein
MTRVICRSLSFSCFPTTPPSSPPLSRLQSTRSSDEVQRKANCYQSLPQCHAIEELSSRLLPVLRAIDVFISSDLLVMTKARCQARRLRDRPHLFQECLLLFFFDSLSARVPSFAALTTTAGCARVLCGHAPAKDQPGH